MLAVTQTIEYYPAAEGREEGYLCLLYELADYDSYDSRLRFKRLFEEHPHPMWVYDVVTLQFLVVNAAAVNHYGYTEAEFMNMTIRHVRPQEELTGWPPTWLWRPARALSAPACGPTAKRTATASRSKFRRTR